MAGAFQTLDPRDLLISNENVTNTVWLNNSPTLNAYFTSSVQVASTTGQFYYNIFAGSAATGSVQFAIAYCDADGSGSLAYNPNVVGLSPTRTNYGQYRSLVVGDEGNSFVFGNQSASYFYALPIERSGYKEELLPGTMTLCISGSGGTPVEHLFLTDDSRLGGAAQFTEAGRVYNLVSGSAGNVYTGISENGWTASSGSYGWFMPDIGTLLLNGPALDGTYADGGVALGTARTTNAAVNNPQKLFTRLNKGASGFTNAGWTLNSNEQLSSDFVFVRARSDEFNYSTNPSFISGSTGAVLFDSFINDPQVYITSVGLYNNNQELVAVAKLSRPLLKDFTKELLVRIKLDF
jgi:hypothetical protein|tara:strand:- start:2688 stop:3737 length:1050 start_codon:yes stop_codon:yes gene_type:complete